MSCAIVTLETVYADGSGAPALVVFAGFRFAVDFLGEVSLTGLSARKAPRKVIGIAKAAYLRALHARADAAWFEKNKAMYST